VTRNDKSALQPRLVVADAAKAIACYREVFGAEEVTRYTGDDGSIVHAELRVGHASWTLKDEDGTDRAPRSDSGASVLLMIDVDDAAAVAQRMSAAGGTIVFPVADHEYGRMGRVQDPFGHVWMINERRPDEP
jgi:PhnB protein